MSKHTDVGTVEWDQQLQLLLFAYRSSVQESTRESPFFLLYGRDPRLPTGTELDTARTEYLVDVDDYRTELVMSMAKAKKIALENICRAQRKQKQFYDRHAGEAKFKVGERVMVYMPGEVSGNKWKIARPYHGPYRILSVTPTNADVQLVENQGEPALFVAISRLRRCYPELPDTSWTGTKKRRRFPATKKDLPPQLVRQEGPVTRAMAKAQAQAQEQEN